MRQKHKNSPKNYFIILQTTPIFPKFPAKFFIFIQGIKHPYQLFNPLCKGIINWRRKCGREDQKEQGGGFVTCKKLINSLLRNAIHFWHNGERYV
jgi:hypothetical protein